VSGAEDPPTAGDLRFIPTEELSVATGFSEMPLLFCPSHHHPSRGGRPGGRGRPEDHRRGHHGGLGALRSFAAEHGNLWDP